MCGLCSQSYISDLVSVVKHYNSNEDPWQSTVAFVNLTQIKKTGSLILRDWSITLWQILLLKRAILEMQQCLIHVGLLIINLSGTWLLLGSQGKMLTEPVTLVPGHHQPHPFTIIQLFNFHTRVSGIFWKCFNSENHYPRVYQVCISKVHHIFSH